MEHSFGVHQLGGYDWFDDLLHEISLKLLLCDVLVMLCGDYYCMYSERDTCSILESVLDSYLKI